MLPSPKPLAKSRVRLLVALHCGFVFIGVATNLLGAILPVLLERLSLNDASGGVFLSAQFVGAFVGTLLSNRRCRAAGKLIFVVATGLWTTAIGIGGLMIYGASGPAAVGAMAFLVGFGIGLVVPTTNLIVAAAHEDERRQAAALNVLNFAWSGGAICAPLFFATTNYWQNVAWRLGVLSAGLFLLGVSLLPFFSFEAQTSKKISVVETAANLDAARFWRTRFAVLNLLLIFFSVGVENALGGWLTTYAQREIAAPVFYAAPSVAFWAMMLFGRLTVSFWLRRLSVKRLMLGNALTVIAGAALLIVAPDAIFLFVGAMLAGWGLSSVFPTALARFLAQVGKDGAEQAKFLFIGGSLGAMSASAAVGFASSVGNSLQTGLLVVLAAAIALLLAEKQIPK
jgi:fucose permease